MKIHYQHHDINGKYISYKFTFTFDYLSIYINLFLCNLLYRIITVYTVYTVCL